MHRAGGEHHLNGRRSTQEAHQLRVVPSAHAALRVAVALSFAGAALTASGLASAQASDPYGPGVRPQMGGGAPPTTSSSSKPPPGAPELHAASGGSDTTLPQGNEPSLPENPLEVSESVQKRIGTDGEPPSPGTGEGVKREFYGLYYNEEAGEYRYRVAFPVWGERTMPSKANPKIEDRASVYGGLYYNRRGAENADDVLFPAIWNLRNPLEGKRTTVVGPFVNRRTKTETDDWLAPLYFTGTRPDGGYTILPPLLSAFFRDKEGGFTLVGPGFCKWKTGPSCDTRTATDIDLGIAPLYFFGQDQSSLYEVVPPLIHYYGYNDRDGSWLNLWGPYYREHTEKREMFHLLPLYWSIWGNPEAGGVKERHTTLLPFFHYGYKGDTEELLVTPFFMNRTGPEGEKTFVTWGYARHRGRTELDMITPLYWDYRDPDTGLQQKLLFPFLFSRTSPREETSTFFPFWSYSERYGVSRSLWVTPFFNHKNDLRGWSTNIMPFVFLGRDGNETHTVIAPFYWDFASPKSRSTVAFPLYWRFSDTDSVHQLVGNVYYTEQKYKNGLDWQIHLFPLFSYGETPDGHWWNVLFGLAGYKRQGTASQVKALYIPISLSE